MKSIANLGVIPESLSIVADDVLEFHAARLLLLIRICGEKGVLKGLTKMAKLDFFVRYPQFFQKATRVLGNYSEIEPFSTNIEAESRMVRYHYGPWDQRYYHVLAYLEAKGLIQTTKDGATINLILTDLGSKSSARLEEMISFATLINQMQQVKKILGHKKGSELKDLVYKIFDDEVAKLPIGEVIK